MRTHRSFRFFRKKHYLQAMPAALDDRHIARAKKFQPPTQRTILKQETVQDNADVNKLSSISKSCGNLKHQQIVSHFKDNKNSSISRELYTFISSCKSGSGEECTVQEGALEGPLNLYTVEKVKHAKLNTSKVAELDMSFVKPGGWLHPMSCTPKHSMALVIPFRDRDEHLAIFLRQLLTLINKRKDVHIRIFVVEQVDDDNFNRGKLRNVGFREALKFFPYTCFVFHDVDLIPEDDRIPYNCEGTPMHMSVAVSKFDYKAPGEGVYADIFGGVQMVSTDQYENVNGFPNTFWTWGGEDDNFFLRAILRKHIKLKRPPKEFARYTMLEHNHEQRDHYEERHDFIKPNVRTGKKLFNRDGLNTLQYEVKNIVHEPLFTRVQVHLHRERELDADSREWFGFCPVSHYGGCQNADNITIAVHKEAHTKTQCRNKCRHECAGFALGTTSKHCVLFRDGCEPDDNPSWQYHDMHKCNVDCLTSFRGSCHSTARFGLQLGNFEDKAYSQRTCRDKCTNVCTGFELTGRDSGYCRLYTGECSERENKQKLFYYKMKDCTKGGSCKLNHRGGCRKQKETTISMYRDKDYTVEECKNLCATICGGFQLDTSMGESESCTLFKAGCQSNHDLDYEFYDVSKCFGVRSGYRLNLTSLRCSSSITAPQHTCKNAFDESYKTEWISGREMGASGVETRTFAEYPKEEHKYSKEDEVGEAKAGAWLRIEFDTLVVITELRILDRDDQKDRVKTVALIFSDGHTLHGKLNNLGNTKYNALRMPGSGMIATTSLEFEVVETKSTWPKAVGFSEIEIYGYER